MSNNYKNTIYRAAIFICLALLVPIHTAQAEEFILKHADTLEASKNEVIVNGNILINYKDAIIEAPEGKIITDDTGRPIKAVFEKRAKIKMTDRFLVADQITVNIKEQTLFAEGNSISELDDKDKNKITISSNYQKLHWSGENASAKGNLKTTYKDTLVTADEVLIIYKNKKPNEAIFYGINSKATIKQPNHHTSANSIIFNLDTHGVKASGDVNNVSWPDDTKNTIEQDPVFVTAEDLFIDNELGKITANGPNKKVQLIYQDTKGESLKAYLVKNPKTRKPEKIIFIGDAQVSQLDKELISEEVVFNFADKKLTSNTIINKRPKTLIYKDNAKP